MKPSTLTTINGKKLSRPQINLLAKLETLGLSISDQPDTLVNPFSGASKTVDGIAYSLTQWVLDEYNDGMPHCGVQTWDRAKYLVLAFWPDVYYSFID